MRINKELAAIRTSLGHVGEKTGEPVYLDTQKILKTTDLNTVLGHTHKGILYGSMIEVAGWESAAKSANMMSIAALAQRDSAHVIWGDLENSFKADWALQRGFMKCPTCAAKTPAMNTCTECNGDGLDWNRLTLIYPYVGRFGKDKIPRLASAQELCMEVEAAMKLERKGCDRLFVVLDSIAALETDEEQKAGLKDANMKTSMSLPKFMGRLLRRWMGIGLTRHAIIVLVNQLRQGPARFGDGTYTTGGNAIRFYPHVRVRVKRVLGSKIVEKKRVVGIKGIIENKKNKAGGEEGFKVGFKLWFKGNTEFLPAKEVMEEED
jgi:RecA/RadA recombinase